MRRAVVLGASMAGLLAARVLSDHADEVLIIERDGSDVDDGPRPGAPQGSQVHALLPAGQLQLERWYPGFTEAAIAAGAVVPPPDGVRFYVEGVLRTAPPVPPTGQATTLVSTRPFLEAMVRHRTMAIGKIRLVVGRAEGLIFDGDRVTGARYVPEGADEIVTESADLVVDAMGRSSRLGDWLEENGWPRPPMLRMPIKLNYATALFRRDERISDVWVAVSTASADEARGKVARIGGFHVVEGDKWIMLVSGYDDDRPTRDVEDFTRRARAHFPTPFGDIAERAEMIGEVITYHQADSRRRDFHKLDRLPAGLVAAGDAVASFNPVYGQGMTSAALHASCLSAYLRSGPSPDAPARAYFEQVRVVVDAAWQTSTFSDLSLPHVDGPYPPAYKLTKWISDVVFAASMTDAAVNRRLDAVMTMRAHPNTLMRPGTVLRALWLSAVRGVARSRRSEVSPAAG
ncbi:FAD-dependent oxidoreductase [Sphaerisporangium album]|uniref:FAD-dependent oxidoreductase n=2 Tax=Sphaerisporangium album TaxID=509200 RepID=A0A367F7Y0_9ACTN|nr:FAD-dependent oxidoreductase [Sphaerisporangium album]